jgi:hypothetical protein
VQSSNSALVSAEPNLGLLDELFAACSPMAQGWNRIEDNDRVRYTFWEGQTPDGRKHQSELPEGKTVFPFDGASDVRIPTADEVVNDHVDYLTEAFHRAMTRVQGNPQTEQSGQAAYARKLIEWIKGTKLQAELSEEAELFAQSGCTYGVVLMEAGWERELGYRYHEITMEELTAAAQARLAQGQQDILTEFPQMLRFKKNDEASIEVLKMMHRAYVEANKPSNYDWDVQELSSPRAREAIRSLRKTGRASLPLPYLCKNQPTVRARTLWEDAWIPEYTGKLQEAPCIFTADFYCEADLRAKGKAEPWDEDWMEQAVKHKGEFNTFTRRHRLQQGIESGDYGPVKDDSELIEVMTAYEKKVDEDGVLSVYRTVYHAGIKGAPGSRKPLVAKYGPLDFPIGTNFPFVAWRFETNKRALLASRGIPQIVSTWQHTLKAQEDAANDRTSFETLPPILVEQIMGVNYRFGPAVQVPVKRGSVKPEFMQMPNGGKTAEYLIDHVQTRVDRYFGRPSAEMPPELALVKRQKRARSFLLACSQMLSFVFKLCSQNLPPEDIEEITGMAPGSFGDTTDIAEDMLYMLTYDVQELSPDFVAAKWKAVGEIEMTDRSGTIDPSKAIRARLRAIDPNLEQEITNDQQGATKQIWDAVKSDFDDMLKGIPPGLTENDPTAEQQLKFAEEILGVSKVYQTALQQDTQFKALLEAWVQSKEHSRDQLGKNKQSGRVGVDMSQAMEAGQRE